MVLLNEFSLCCQRFGARTLGLCALETQSCFSNPSCAERLKARTATVVSTRNRGHSPTALGAVPPPVKWSSFNPHHTSFIAYRAWIVFRVELTSEARNGRGYQTVGIWKVYLLRLAGHNVARKYWGSKVTKVCRPDRGVRDRAFSALSPIRGLLLCAGSSQLPSPATSEDLGDRAMVQTVAGLFLNSDTLPITTVLSVTRGARAKRGGRARWIGICRLASGMKLTDHVWTVDELFVPATPKTRSTGLPQYRFGFLIPSHVGFEPQETMAAPMTKLTARNPVATVRELLLDNR